ncbi:Hypothetical predicted protein [Marmota monax]|uniref:Uncharacterized protein n=1 Tax=Marmota monax TaxID=9995 RepID=A0A5E4BDK4_MARMO|nr:hypothetical protein GHT09_008381 [Marmota monax]VTJ66702.1 Hypothetical predicted protein [Marmota monax]
MHSGPEVGAQQGTVVQRWEPRPCWVQRAPAGGAAQHLGSVRLGSLERNQSPGWSLGTNSQWIPNTTANMKPATKRPVSSKNAKTPISAQILVPILWEKVLGRKTRRRAGSEEEQTSHFAAPESKNGELTRTLGEAGVPECHPHSPVVLYEHAAS